MMPTAPDQAWIEQPDGERIPLRGNCAIGRASDNQVVLRDERVSRRHALIHLQGAAEWWLVDLGSSNGTYVNRVRVSQPIRLRDQDRLEFGPFVLVFHQGPTPTEPDLETLTDRTALDLRTTPCWLLVADVQGSTALAQRMADQELAVVIGRWFADCQQRVEGNGGIINKYLGDGFFAYWQHAEAAASGLRRALEQLKGLQATRAPEFRIVLHHGPVVMGGRASLGEESLSGREVNFVFRMEKLAAELRCPRLLSEPARRLLEGHLETIPVGAHPVPGFPGTFEFTAY